jgi:hypothetical protein
MILTVWQPLRILPALTAAADQPWALTDWTDDTLAAHDLLPRTYDAVFVSGSVVVGWAHANSDVDVYVVSDEPAPLQPQSFARVAVDPPAVPSVVAFVHGRRIDVEYWLPTQLEQILAKVAQIDFEGTESAGSDLMPEEINILFRLSVGQPLAGEQWLRAMQRRITASAVRPILTSLYFNKADGLIDDAVGQMRSGDSASAVIAARNAFGLTIDGLLAHHGQLVPAEKWRARKFERANPPEIEWDEYWRIETMSELDRNDPEAWVVAVVERCQALIAQVDIA